jgi:hypothetical protein
VAARFDENGVRFLYPENWAIEREELDGGWSVSVLSPETAFLTLSYHENAADFGRLADSALEALRADYPDLEAELRTDTLAGQPAVGHDVRFFSFDLTNTAWVRGVPCESGSLVILCQVNDLELDRNGQVLKAICASLAIDE